MNYYVCHKLGTLPNVSPEADIDHCQECKQLVHVMPKKLLDAEIMDATIICLECIEKMKSKFEKEGREIHSFRRGVDNSWQEAEWGGAKKAFGKNLPSEPTFESILNTYYIKDGVILLLSSDRLETLNKILSIPFNPDIHYPILYIHIHFAILEIAKKILDYIPDKENALYKQLEDFYNALIDCEDNNLTAVFPLNVPYRNWWNGPHLDFPKKEEITSWFPMRIQSIENNNVIIIVGKRESDTTTYGEVNLPRGTFPDDIEEETYGEIAFYEEDYVIKMHPIQWDQPKELKLLTEKVTPYLIKSSIARQKQVYKDLFGQ